MTAAFSVKGIRRRIHYVTERPQDEQSMQKDEEGNNEGPEIGFHAIPQRVRSVRGFARTILTG
jgi:hypothetical protein